MTWSYCLVCSRAVAGSPKVCPICGADSSSSRRVFISLSRGEAFFRLVELPFDAGRAWAKTHFCDLDDGFGNAAYKYLPKSSSGALTVTADVEGVRFRSLLPAGPDTNHFVLLQAEREEPLTEAGVPVALRVGTEPVGRLKLWSGNRKVYVMDLEIRFEVFGS